ncbi:hypothetical protein BV898_13058 [Hypsibius exemplaris]|uniref:Uncharacterized protein n=1 Tax=Hypsibius exemplaris TaxID=2072580 RepID=A0A1W0WBR8_HYPEX|nr:hypothetical protein BV898_13058 [Hypsibius exemplaris]
MGRLSSSFHAEDVESKYKTKAPRSSQCSGPVATHTHRRSDTRVPACSDYIPHPGFTRWRAQVTGIPEDGTISVRLEMFMPVRICCNCLHMMRDDGTSWMVADLGRSLAVFLAWSGRWLWLVCSTKGGQDTDLFSLDAGRAKERNVQTAAGVFPVANSTSVYEGVQDSRSMNQPCI